MKQGIENVAVNPAGTLTFMGKEYKCALGKGGVSPNKTEGDGTTPVGCFPIREVYYRQDRLGELALPFTMHAIERNDAWCDDAEDERYNKHIKLESGSTDESLWREDHVYDVVAVLGYNDDPPVQGKGSAIFMHVAREGYTPTEGCIALSLEDLLNLLVVIKKEALVCIQA